jgi:hypothetical protein
VSPPAADPGQPTEPEAPGWRTPSNPWTNLALTVPVFVGYHLGVVTLPVRNAADVVTMRLSELASHNLPLYVLLTSSIGLCLIGVLALLGRGQAFELWRLGVVAIEGAAYAVAMGVVATVLVGQLRLGPSPPPSGILVGIVLALGAGLYEEIAFRVLLYGGPAWLIGWRTPSLVRRSVLQALWCVVAAALFSGWHYVGAMGEPFDPRSFVFRWICGVAFTLIFVARGFAPAVWTHVLYDVWALALAR